MDHKYALSEQASELVGKAFRYAADLDHGFVGSEHILWSFYNEPEGGAAKVLLQAGIDRHMVNELIEKYDTDAKEFGSKANLKLTVEAVRTLELAEAQSKKMEDKLIEPEHLLLGMLQEQNCAAAKLITSTGADIHQLLVKLLDARGRDWGMEAPVEQETKKAETKTLELYSRDLTAMAKEDKFDPVIARNEEIQRVIQILSRRTKNNPVLVGEAGVGKTAIAEGLAQQIVAGDVPQNIINMRILSLDLNKMVSGTKYRGDFEARIDAYLEEARQADDVILFIDELHTLIGAGAAEGSMDAANILKPALGRGDIQVIGATTLNEYKKHIEKDEALERRFQPVTINEPSKESSIEILTGIKERYEQFHDLMIPVETIHAAVEFSSRYIQDRFLPDKAIDLLDEAASCVKTMRLTKKPAIKKIENQIKVLDGEKLEAVRIQNFEEAAMIRDRQNTLKKELAKKQAAMSDDQSNIVTVQDIADVVSRWTGIPVTMLTESESQRLLNLEKILHDRVIGQEDAVTAVSKAIRRSRVGIKDPNRPIGTFLFLGPTGVGKTELCKALAEAMFQDDNAIIRMDMSEYREQHTVSKLIGSPPGYVGYDEGGQLTERVRRKPYSVILFDEIEKAHGDVWNVLLQIMDDGRLTDGQGRSVDFRNAVVVMTSNIGARDITGKLSLGFTSSNGSADGTRPLDEIRSKVMEEVKKAFQPEFLNRIDDIITFHQLGKEHIRMIARNMISDLMERTQKAGVNLEIDTGAIDLLAERGYDPMYGARPLRRTIQSSLEDIIAEKILEGRFGEADSLVVTTKDGEIKTRVKRSRKKKELSTVS